MKIKSIIYGVVVVANIIFAESLMAECINPINPNNQQAEIAVILQNYVTYATTKDDVAGVYEICFDSNEPFGFEGGDRKNITISVPSNHTLKIVGLKFPAFSDILPLDMTSDDKILILSGSNITLDNVTLTGNGTGTAIQVNGANVEIKNSQINNFANGIDLINSDGFKIETVTFSGNQKDFVNPPAVDSNFFGIKCDIRKTIEKDGKKYEVCDISLDTNGVIKVAGKKPNKISGCSGNIDLVIAQDNVRLPVTSCELKALSESEAPFYFAKYDYDNLVLIAQEIAAGECVFQCVPQEGNPLTIKSKIGLSYNNIPIAFNANQDLLMVLENNLSVPSTGLGGIAMVGTTSGATVETEPIYVGGNSGDLFADGQNKDSNDDGKGQTGGEVAQGSSKGCGATLLPAGIPFNPSDVLTFTYLLSLPALMGARRFFK